MARWTSLSFLSFIRDSAVLISAPSAMKSGMRFEYLTSSLKMTESLPAKPSPSSLSRTVEQPRATRASLRLVMGSRADDTFLPFKMKLTIKHLLQDLIILFDKILLVCGTSGDVILYVS